MFVEFRAGSIHNELAKDSIIAYALSILFCDSKSFYLCLSCLGQAMYVILLNPISIHNIETADPHDSTSGYCIFEGVLKCTFDLSSIIWTTLIIYSIFASVVRNVSLESSELFYLLLAYLLPLILSIMYAISMM